MYLPKALKKRLRATTQWQPISLQFPQEIIQVRLVTATHEFDVSVNNVAAALKPLTIAIGLDAQMRSAVEFASEPELHFVDRHLKRPIGVLRLRHMKFWNTSETLLGLFEVRYGTHRCARWPRRVWDRWMYRRAASKNTRPDSFSLAPNVLEQTMIFYICPRPVFLVSVDDGQHSNVFPMDLVGPIAPDRFTLALRSTSPSVETIKHERKVALSSIAADDYQIAYQLGAHHKRVTIDPDTLPFKLSRSREFSLPIPVTALRVREIEILDFQSIGSHTLFVGRIVSDEQRGNGPQLFHTCGVHQRLRTHHGLPFQVPRPGSDR
jgi:flavin reductase (DIM6/NTAB) family NADH-FMN oxidoreductase RutF